MPTVKDITWIRDTHKFANGEHGYIGKVAVGSVSWSSSKEGRYKAVNIIGRSKAFDDSDNAKAWVYACLVQLVNIIAVSDGG